MPTKRRRKQLESARAASLEVFKKRRSEASPLPNLAQLRVDDHKLSTADTADTKGESGTWFWNESANKTDLDTEKEGNDDHKMNLKGNESRTKEAVSSEVHKVEIKWSREGQDKLRGDIERGQRELNETSKISSGIRERGLQKIRYSGIMATKSRPGHDFNSQ